MNIFYATDENYCIHTCVSIVSLLENNRTQTQITIYLLEYNVSADSHARLMSIEARYDNTSFVILSGEAFLKELDRKNIVLPAYHNNITASFILFIDMLLPPTIEKVLCLDSDTLVLGNLNTLMNTNMNNRVLAAAEDWDFDSIKTRTMKKTHSNPHIFHFNSGVILFNLKLLRQKKLTQRFITLIQMQEHIWSFPDQDILNHVVPSQYIKKLPLRYNYCSGWSFLLYWFKIRQVTGKWYSLSSLRRNCSHKTILHFLGYPNGEKAWNTRFTCQSKRLYQQYRKLTPWGNVPLERNSHSLHGIRLLCSYLDYFADLCPFISIRRFYFTLRTGPIKFIYHCFYPLHLKRKRKKGDYSL